MDIRCDFTRLRGIRPLPSLNARFWSLIVEQGECWLFCGKARSRFGYGLFSIPVESPRGPAWRFESAHRLVYVVIHGPIPKGLDVLHSCDRPACVRPEHLRTGTALDNMADKVARGRQPRGGRVPGIRLPRESLPTRAGEGNYHAKLSDVAVVEIRKRYAAGGISLANLARAHHVTDVLIGMIVRGKSRKGAAGPISVVPPVIGERVGGAKMTADGVLALRAAYAAGGVSIYRLAEQYGIAFQTVSNIVRRQTWQHVPE